MAVESKLAQAIEEKERGGTNSKKKPNNLIRSIRFPRLSFLKPFSRRSKSRYSCLCLDPARDNSSPEQLSPVQMPDSSPNYMKFTTTYDARKGSSQGGIGLVDVSSVDSSTSRSLVEELSAKKKDNKMNNQTELKKIIKNFGSKRSFRRRSRSKVKNNTESLFDYAASPQNPSSVEVSDSSSPHYMKATSCSEGKRGHIQASLQSSENSFDISGLSMSPPTDLPSHSASSTRKPLKTFSRTSSMRSVKILINKASFKSNRGPSRCCQVPDKATCSSTIKDSKFPEHVDLQPGKTESDRISKYKVCSYHHCSLNGHCDDPSSPPVKRVYRRKRLLKSQKSIRQKVESKNTEPLSVDETTGFRHTQMIPSLDRSVYDEISTTEDAEHFEVNEAIEYADLAEIAFGETSFPDKSYKETLDIMRKYSTQEQGTLLAASKCCNCIAREQNESSSVSDESINGPLTTTTRSVLDDIDEAQVSNVISSVSASNISLELEENMQEDSKDNPNKDPDSTLCPLEDSESKNFSPLEDAEQNASANESHKQLLPKKKHLSMWNLIHRHMISGTSAESDNKLASEANKENHQDGVNISPSAKSSDSCADFSDRELLTANEESENQELELRKLFAVKLVREAIEKILLPEIQDQSSDDQSVTSEACEDQETLEMNHNEVSTKEIIKSVIKNEEADVASKSKGVYTEDIGRTEQQTTQKEVKSKFQKKAPKHWSNLKKWIILQRFIKELEKVGKINPRKPRHLLLEPDSEAETIKLRPQTEDERKRAEEWMLDYALQQAISQLAPTQKRKVDLLVKAFETVVPPQGNNGHVAFPKLKASNDEHLQITKKENGFASRAGNTGYTEVEVVAGIDRNCAENDCSMYKADDPQQFIELSQKLDEVIGTSNDEVSMAGKTQKEDHKGEYPKFDNELQIDFSRESHENEEHDSSNDSRKEMSSAISSITGAVDVAKETDMIVSLASECEATEGVSISSDENKENQEPEDLELQGSHKGTSVDLHSESPSGGSVARDRRLELDNQDGDSTKPSDTTHSSIIDGNRTSFAAQRIQNSTSACDAAMQEKVAMAEAAKECEQQPKKFRGFSLLLPKSDTKDSDAASRRQVDKPNYISMWHMISQHVLSDVATKVGSELLDGMDDEVEDSNTPAEMQTCNSLKDFSKTKDNTNTISEDHHSSHSGRSFCRDDAVKLIREAVNEILTTPIQDDSSDTQSVTSDIIRDQEFSETEGGSPSSSDSTDESLRKCDMSEGRTTRGQETKDPIANTIPTEEEKVLALAKSAPETPKSKNWSKLKKLILLKRSIKALERERKFNPRQPQLLTPTPDREPEKVDLRPQMTDERKKAEQWMLDYAVQHIVTKLTPARKRRVAMLVEAFEAVVPLPEL